MTASDSIELRFEPPGPGPWEQDPVHFPRPLTRYFQETHPPALKRGTNDFARFYGMIIDGLQVAYVNGFTGLGVGATRFAADVCLDLLDGADTPRTRLEMVRRKPLPFPPEPVASAGIQATRWSLDRADHSAGKRNALLRTLDALGLGFDS